MREDLESTPLSGGSYSWRGPPPIPGGSGASISGLPPSGGRRRSNEMEEGRYYLDSDGKERIRLSRSGSAAVIPGQSQWRARN